MTLRQLQYVVALDDHRHFLRAAVACFVTQPTLTMQVRKLEEELAVSLFDRRVQPVHPTAIGASVIAQARVVLRESAQLNALVGELHRGIRRPLPCRRYSYPWHLTSYRCSFPGSCGRTRCETGNR
ncbi:MAG: LysR family transcriptional regulator [Flavobacteriales bacterium]|nr:LysR family transcriptional regulator [Flavobacteriales bacterium]